MVTGPWVINNGNAWGRLKFKGQESIHNVCNSRRMLEKKKIYVFLAILGSDLISLELDL